MDRGAWKATVPGVAKSRTWLSNFTFTFTLENTAVATGLEKVSFLIPKKDNAKECSNYCTIVLILHASKIMLRILQARLQQYMNWELPDVQAGFKKVRGTRDQIANICWIIEKARKFQKSIYFCFINFVKAFVGIIKNCGKFLEIGIPDYLSCVLRILCAGQEATTWNSTLKLRSWHPVPSLQAK